MSNMKESKYSLATPLLKYFVSMLGIYLLSTLIFYFYNLYSINNASFFWLYLVGHAVQILGAVALGVFYRKKDSNLYSQNKNQQLIFIVFCVLSAISILLNVMGLPDRMYFTITSSLNLYNLLGDNLFVAVLLETFFNNYLLTSFFICSTIVFFIPLKKLQPKATS